MITKAATYQDVLYVVEEWGLQEKSQPRGGGGESYFRCGRIRKFFVREGKRATGKEVVEEFLEEALQYLEYQKI